MLLNLRAISLDNSTCATWSIPTGTYETEIQFTTDTGFTFTDNALTNKWLGVDAPTFEDGSSYVIAVKNGYAVCAKVGA